jgi:hypothetical protein
MNKLINSLNEKKTVSEYLLQMKNMDASIIDREIDSKSSIILSHGLLHTEREFVWSLIHAYKTKNVDGYKKAKYSAFSLNVAQSKKILNQYPMLNCLNTLELLSASLWEIYQLKQAEKSCTLDAKEKSIEFLDISKVLNLLNHKHGAIVESSGLLQLTTNNGWGGVIRGLVSKDILTKLLEKNKISQVPYFNSKGRKLYELNRGQKYTIPLWMQKLPSSYLKACGVN